MSAASIRVGDGNVTEVQEAVAGRVDERIAEGPCRVISEADHPCSIQAACQTAVRRRVHGEEGVATQSIIRGRL